MLTKAQVAASVLRGMRRAAKNYRKWSGDWISDYGAESVATTFVADCLHRSIVQKKEADSGFVTLETSTLHIAEAAQLKRPIGRPRLSLGSTKRVDVVYWLGFKPRAVVEIKRSWSDNGADRDWRKISDLLRSCGPERDGTLRYGIIATLLWARVSARANIVSLAERFERFATWAKGDVPHGWSIDIRGPLPLLTDKDFEGVRWRMAAALAIYSP